MRRVLITGVTGQDGSYLADMLLHKGYEVHGIVRRSSTIPTERIDHIVDDLHLHYGCVTDGSRVTNLIAEIRPDEIYHMAAQSHVRISFDTPMETVQSIVAGGVNVLEAVRMLCPSTRVYQSCSSEMFGALPPPQSETTPFEPVSPYACAKVFLYHLGRLYRRAHNLFVSNGILFNHESERRGVNFVTRKVAQAAARIKAGKQDSLVLGNLDAVRDWGYAPEYCEAMWLMLQHSGPDDFVVATGVDHTIRELLTSMFGHVDLDWQDYVTIDPKFYRKAEVAHLRGSPDKVRDQLGWKSSIAFSELCHRMVTFEVRQLQGDTDDLCDGRYWFCRSEAP